MSASTLPKFSPRILQNGKATSQIDYKHMPEFDFKVAARKEAFVSKSVPRDLFSEEIL